MRHAIAASLGALVCLLPFNAARADWEYAKWGMTPEQVVAASRGAVKVIPPSQRKRLPEIKLENAAEGIFTEGTLTLRVHFSFDTDRGGLEMVGYGVLNAAQNGLLKAWLIKRHGPPQSSGGLPAIGFQTFHWRNPDEIDLNITENESAYVLHAKATHR